MKQMTNYMEERDFREREKLPWHDLQGNDWNREKLTWQGEERESRQRGGMRRRRRGIRIAMSLLVVIVLLVFGRFLIIEVKEFLGAGDYEILSEEEETSDVLIPGEIPLYLQKDRRWRQEKYGSDVMGITGCGPTCLSMVVCGLRQDEAWLPPRVAKRAEEEGYYVSGSGSSWSLMTEGAAEFGLAAEQLPLQAGIIKERLREGHPVICIMGPGDFTDAGHFIVLSGVDDEGNIMVKDPNSRANSDKNWNLEQLMSQMKNLWAYSYVSG